MVYRIIITVPAARDVESIVTYIARELNSPQAAVKLLRDIDERIISLQEMPERFPLVPDKRFAKLGIRSVPVNNYLIFYVVGKRSRSVNIVRVIYSRRDWVNLL